MTLPAVPPAGKVVTARPLDKRALAEDQELQPDWGRAQRLGLIVVALFFGGFGGWAAIAPLASAIIAQGSIKVVDNRKTVQNLEGGIVKRILVRENSLVEQGDLLIQLDDNRAQLGLVQLRDQLLVAKANEARLLAERDAKAEIQFPEILTSRMQEPRITDIMRVQRNLFEARRSVLESNVGVLQQRTEQLNEQIRGGQVQLDSQRQQLKYIEEELRGVKELMDKNLERKPRLLALQRAQSGLVGDVGSSIANIARLQQAIGETRMQLAAVRVQRDNEILTELRSVQSTLIDFEERIRQTEEVVQRMEIRAPVAGKVLNLRVFTVGGVVRPTEPLLEIVPSEARVIVDAMVQTRDGSSVRAGQVARVMLTSYNMRIVRPLDGRVAEVSGDVVPSEQPGAPQQYRAIIEIDDDSLARAQETSNVTLTPGLPAMVTIVTGERTLLDYLLSPLFQSVNLALKER
jgi:HlyD family secretion protein/epimerase transport system membrane fusion protein